MFALLFMLNPSVLENSTYAWTKLITVFFVLTGVYFFLPALAAGSRRRLAAAFVFLAAGLLAHYSAGPYAVAIVTAYFWWRRSHWWRRAFWTETAICALPAALLLATWFVWSLREFGAAGTFLTNAAVTQAPTQAFSDFVRDRILGHFKNGAEREGVAKCKNRCVEEEQHCTVECKKEDRGHKRYLECTHECSTDKIRCNKECVSDAK